MRDASRGARRSVDRGACRPAILGSPRLFINLGPKPLGQALERERPQIVSNFAPSASGGYESSSHPYQRIPEEFRAGRSGLSERTILRPWRDGLWRFTSHYKGLVSTRAARFSSGAISHVFN